MHPRQQSEDYDSHSNNNSNNNVHHLYKLYNNRTYLNNNKVIANLQCNSCQFFLNHFDDHLPVEFDAFPVCTVIRRLRQALVLPPDRHHFGLLARRLLDLPVSHMVGAGLLLMWLKIKYTYKTIWYKCDTMWYVHIYIYRSVIVYHNHHHQPPSSSSPLHLPYHT